MQQKIVELSDKYGLPKSKQYQEFSDKIKSIFEASKKDTMLQKCKKN